MRQPGPKRCANTRQVEKKEGKAIRKDQRLKERRQQWTARLQQIYTERQQTAASRKAPLEHFERIQDSLAGIEAGIKSESQRQQQQPPPTTKPHLSCPKPTSSRGRVALLYVAATQPPVAPL